MKTSVRSASDLFFLKTNTKPQQFQTRLTATMVIDFVGCWIIELVTKHFFADLEPKAMVTRGQERRLARREAEAAAAQTELASAESEKKTQ